jgi:hypothetical protein
MRTLAAALLVLCVLAPARAADVSFKRVWPQWYDADSFESLYEDHTGRELTGRWIPLRSQPEDRGGLYFLTRVENPGAALAGTTFILRVIAPDSTDTRTYSFPADVPAGSRLFQIGLTGKDWTKPRVEPVAWELELRAPDGRVLASARSFLWAKPR